jgi:hypothetical protein
VGFRKVGYLQDLAISQRDRRNPVMQSRGI